MGDDVSIEISAVEAPVESKKERGPRGVPGRGQHNVALQIKRAWKASGKLVSLKQFAQAHRPENTAWKANKA